MKIVLEITKDAIGFDVDVQPDEEALGLSYEEQAIINNDIQHAMQGYLEWFIGRTDA
tara:strand:- start:1317 stop:1487 length:171 start_codon:yes stop_codon:yes gene_type:complete